MFRCAVLFSFLLCLAHAAFIAPDALDSLQVVPPPPAPDSIVAEAERATLLLLAQNRTPEQVGLARRWEKYDIFKMVQPVVGEWATAQTLPKLAAFIKNSTGETRPFTDRAKTTYSRRRPHEENPNLALALDNKPDGPSYPSGHATAAWLHATLLAAALPDHAAEFLHQAELVCLSRLYGGAHYPSDVVAGRRLGTAIAQAMLKSPETQHALDEIRAEFAAALAAHKKAA